RQERLAAEPGDLQELELRCTSLEPDLQRSDDARRHSTEREVLEAVGAAEMTGLGRHQHEVQTPGIQGVERDHFPTLSFGERVRTRLFGALPLLSRTGPLPSDSKRVTLSFCGTV